MIDSPGHSEPEQLARDDHGRHVLEFLDRWKDGDVDALLPYFTPDGLYDHNIPMSALSARGHDAIREMISGFFSFAQFTIVTTRLTSQDGIVFTERIDTLRFLDGRQPLDLPCAGVMEMRDGRIAHWRDYVDLGTVEAVSGLDFGPRDLLPAS